MPSHKQQPSKIKFTYELLIDSPTFRWYLGCSKLFVIFLRLTRMQGRSVSWLVGLFFLLSTSLGTAQGAKHFTWTPALRTAYQLTLDLRVTEARSLLKQIERNDPDNLLRHHVANYGDFLELFLKEEEADFERLEPMKDIRLNALAGGPDRDPNTRYTQANIYLQWAIARLKFGEYAGAFRDVNRAFKLLERNAEQFPDFLPNKKELGLLHAVVGTIPDQYKWGLKLISSLDGTIEQGRSELESLLAAACEDDFIYLEETTVFYAYLLLHLADDSQEAWRILGSVDLNPERSLLATFVKANVAMRTSRNEEAIRLLEQRPRGPQYLDFYYLDLIEGIARLRRLDRKALVPLRRYVNHFKGKNFFKEAWQKIAWSHLLFNDDPDGYRRAMAACQTTGHETVGADKSAQAEALSGTIPQRELLAARLLYDGGYFAKAEEQLKAFAQVSGTSFAETLEYEYRLGRVYQAQGAFAKAKQHFNKTLAAGADSRLYFACNSALQLGLIYEDEGNKSEARKYFEKCLSLRPEAFKGSLHQQAKAGLNRLEH